MFAYILRRIAFMPLSLLLVSAIAFIVLRLTGNPVDIYLDVNRTPEQVEALTQRLHLNEPLLVQYAIYLRDVLGGNFGESLQFGGPAIEAVWERFGATAELLAFALLLASSLGILAGVVSAVWKDKLVDHLISTIAVAAQSMPSFWLGILLIEIFSVKLHWLPTSGRGDWRQLVLPALTLAAFVLPNIILIARASTLDVLNEQFVTTAVAKGASRPRILFVHVIRNALNPVMTFIGLQVGRLMGGAIITETIFAWPGVGRLMVGSIFQRDVPVVLAGVFVVSIVTITVNLLVDVLLSINDPRIRLN